MPVDVYTACSAVFMDLSDVFGPLPLFWLTQFLNRFVSPSVYIVSIVSPLGIRRFVSSPEYIYPSRFHDTTTSHVGLKYGGMRGIVRSFSALSFGPSVRISGTLSWSWIRQIMNKLVFKCIQVLSGESLLL